MSRTCVLRMLRPGFRRCFGLGRFLKRREWLAMRLYMVNMIRYLIQYSHLTMDPRKYVVLVKVPGYLGR
ncbi:hypothetical protein VFPPC_16531 [Pochonia chlamydosporia 170]|uniref:Uncharacterized protein n=1 Tax=Pochonia chlamydosporia 170 TaxID=1380566 RepID=A0A179F8E2_METCM|nr:hypothetical protein VFPPC_16531 [Pochonia chlamydosporia 170]OAQ61610.2 hypothetical protein VFPPC_16531 [Pochonia chlamydosporia 170]